jgi:hypothetical protein
VSASGGGAHTISASYDGTNIVVTIDGVAQSSPLASVSSLSLAGGNGDDSFTIDTSLASAGIPVSLDGGAGSDTLNGPSADTSWSVTGSGSGSVGGVSFTGFEHLVGAAGNRDSFVIEGSGSIASIEGGAGGYDVVSALGNFASVVSTITGPDSGTIARDGDTFAYSGMEPATIPGAASTTIDLLTTLPSATHVTIHDDATANQFLVTPDVGEEQTITNASSITTLTINASSGVATTFVLNAVDSAFTGTIRLHGSSSADSFTVDGYTGTSELTGNAGGDTYAFGDQFGTVTVTDSAANDNLDFTPRHLDTHPLVVDATNKVFTSDPAGQTLTLAGAVPGSIDVNLLGGVASTIDGVVDQVQTLEQSAESAITELRNALPLLPTSDTESLATLLGVSDKLHTWVSNVDTALGLLSGTQKLSALQTAIGGAVNQLGITSSTTYRRAATAPHHLEVLLALGLDKSSSFSKALDFGAQAQSVGLTVSGLNLSVATHLTGTLTLGSTTDSGTATPFVDPSSSLSFHIHAATGSVTGIALHLSFLSVTISGSATIDGTVVLSAQDPTPSDGDITATDLSNNGVSSLISVSSPADSFAAAFTGTLSGLTATGGANIASATLTVGMDGSSIFGGDTGPVGVNVSLSTDTSAINLIDSFSNIGPGDVLGMLQQLGTMLSSMAGSGTLNLPIPFTSLTVGDALNYATSFKHRFIDPLFKSGDSASPDANGDGKFDVNDINFDSIQTLLDKLDSAFGLSPGTLTANFDPTTKELTFEFSFDDNLGIGTPVVIDTNPVVTDVLVQNGNSSSAPPQKEIQLLVVNATGGTFKIGLDANESAASFLASADAHAGIQSAIEGFTVGGATPYSGHVHVEKHGNVYTIVWDASVGDVPGLSVDSSSLTGTAHDQSVIVPGGTSRFWLAYPDSGLLGLTDALSGGSDVTGALNGLSGITAATATKADLSNLDSSLGTGVQAPAIFAVHLGGGGTPKALVGAGGFNVDFGTSVGDLVGVKTSGSIIPLAQLSAHAIFGVNLNTTSVLSIAPASVSNGPQATITTTQEGGTLASVTTTQQGGSGNHELQQLTVRGRSGSFKLSGNGSFQTVSWSSPASDATIQSKIAALGGDYAGVALPTHIDTAAGRVYTIDLGTTTKSPSSEPTARCWMGSTSSRRSRSRTRPAARSRSPTGRTLCRPRAPRRRASPHT